MNEPMEWWQVLGLVAGMGVYAGIYGGMFAFVIHNSRRHR